ncbi:mitochondrial import translocase, subunit Tom22, partial [Conidiobolus coronatus NRRL 28638]
DESLLDRIYALKDIIPPNQRLAISNTVSSVYNGVHTAFSIIGKTGWVLSTSAFVVLLPLMIAYEKDQELLMRSGQYPGMEQGAQVI